MARRRRSVGLTGPDNQQRREDEEMRSLSALVTVVAVAAVAGCGGGSKSSSTTGGAQAQSTATSVASSSTQEGAAKPTGKQLSASQLIVSADAICTRLNARLDRDHIRNNADVVRVAPQRAAAERITLEELRKLVPPPALAATYAHVLADRETLAQDTVLLGAEISAKRSPRAVRSLYLSSTELVRKMEALASRAGFAPCGLLG
jgi:hypothetical protein